MGTKMTQAENFIRSATAPDINAGVIEANVIKKATKIRSSGNIFKPSRPI